MAHAWYGRCSAARVSIRTRSWLCKLALLPVVVLSLGSSCHIDDASSGQSTPVAREEDFGPPPPLKSRVELLAKLGREPRFLVGLGNDLPGEEEGYDFTQAGIYTLPVTLDVHYVYLSGLHGEQGEKGPGWPDYEPDGSSSPRSPTTRSSAACSRCSRCTRQQHAARGGWTCSSSRTS